MLTFDFLSDSSSSNSNNGGIGALLGGLLSTGGNANNSSGGAGILGGVLDSIGGMFSHENGDTFEANSKPKTRWFIQKYCKLYRKRFID